MQVRLDEVLESDSLWDESPKLAAFIRDSSPEDTRLIEGRALYPRFYGIGEGEPGGSMGLAPGDSPHFYFFLIGPSNMVVHIPMEEAPEIDFPNASDVLVFGCQGEGNFPLAVFVNSPDNVLLRSDFPKAGSCSEMKTIP